MKKQNVIIFCDRPQQKQNAGTIIDHIDAFEKFSQHNIFIFSNILDFPPHLSLNKFDVLVIHYSSCLLNYDYINAEAQQRIREFQGLKVLFLQDEYRQVNFIHYKIRELGIHLLFTCYPETEIEKVYSEQALPGLVKINTLTGYVPAHLLNIASPLIRARSIDVGYRARQLPYWYGRLGQEKTKIADEFIKCTQGMNLSVDISYQESQRIYGDKWISYIQSCKTMLGVESGASVVDFTGELEKIVSAYQASHPEASFEEIHAKFLQDHDGLIRMNQISPRCFEAIALKTALILFEGNYSGILQPWQHYIPLKKDFSNIDEVVKCIKDDGFLQALVDRTYDEIALNEKYSYAAFIQQFDQKISEISMQKNLQPCQLKYTQQQFKQDSRKNLKMICKVRLFYLYQKCSGLVSPQVKRQIKRFLAAITK